jgi:hypothetical protein
MTATSQTDRVTYAEPTIDCPVEGTTLPAAAFSASGTLDKDMYVLECYFWSNIGRKNADCWSSKDGHWHANFTNVDVCSETGHIWVVTVDFDLNHAQTAKCSRLSVDRYIDDDPCASAEKENFPPLQIHLGTPASGDKKGTSFAAQGTLDPGTGFSKCVFSCPNEAPVTVTNAGITMTGWTAQFSNLSECPSPGGSLVAFGNDKSLDGHGNIVVSSSP